MAQQLLVFYLLLLPLAAAFPNALPGCREKCGDNLTIPYPFGIGKGCSLNDSYLVTCDDTNRSNPIAYQGLGGTLQILSLSLDGKMRMGIPFYAKDCYNSSGRVGEPNSSWIDLEGSPLRFSTRNKFTALGCDTFGGLIGESIEQSFVTGCESFCNDQKTVLEGSCTGIGCCQSPIPPGLRSLNLTVGSLRNHTKSWQYNPCSFAFLVDQEWFSFKRSYLSDNGRLNIAETIPIVLDWAIRNSTCQQQEEARQRGGVAGSYGCGPNSKCVNSNNGPGYNCFCNSGYEGNPYLPQGCQDINECENSSNDCVANGICNNMNGSFSCSCPEGYDGDGKVNGSRCVQRNKASVVIATVGGTGLGLVFLIVCSSFLYWAIKRRRLIKLREKFFQQNGGLLLQQQISSRNGVSEFNKIFTVEDLKKATNNYDESRILGQGGYGTVYKGTLPDNRVVAIKKSKIMDQSQIIQFVNEVDILSQIKHRNVVKLLGCCLETEVPLLVYEYVPNGTLFEHIHGKSRATYLSWDKRLRIASETAGALAYLHSAHSIPILHRDIKSSNILLDDNFIAKVADFGASRLVPLDQNQMTTLVQGTLGYLDPECFHTGRLTDKSDVYSFGVVLVELLTGEKPLSPDRSEDHRSLVMYFISSIKENRLLQILDEHVVNEGGRELPVMVAELARRCLKVKGEERPTMKEVAAELDGLRKFQEHPWTGHNEETQYLLGETSSFSVSYDATSQFQDSLGNDFMQSPLEITR